MRQAFTDQDKSNLKAKKFLMWLFVISSFMLFAALTSGYIVYTAGSPERGLKALLPNVFIYSSVVIVLSSITMHLAYKSAKALKFDKQKLYLSLTILLGVTFLVLQLTAWRTLINQGVYFVNFNASQSFVYVFTGAHLLHIIAGILLLIRALWGIMKNISQTLNLFRLEVTAIFWHFLDILWIYLYVFLLLNQ